MVNARAVAMLAAVVTATALGGADASAQTLTNPYPKPAASPSVAAKSQAQDHLKPCPAYGAGFVQLSGTHTCIKIGGSVTTDAGMGQ
jgi:hypothetical protein